MGCRSARARRRDLDRGRRRRARAGTGTWTGTGGDGRDMHGPGVENESERGCACEERHDNQGRATSDLNQQPDHRSGGPVPDLAPVETT
jgi:hypothetical protein